MSSGLSNKIIQIALDHARKVKDCGTTLARCIELWFKGEYDEARKLYEFLVEIENDADKLKNSIFMKVAEADMLGLIGKDSDFTSLILKTDQIVDYGEGTAQRLMNMNWKNIPDNVKAKAIELSEVIMNTLILVRDMFFAISDNPDKIIKLCTQIDKAERESDLIFRELQRILYSEELKDVDLRIILPFLDAMEHLEDMGDIAERVADNMRILYIARFGSK
ncbi:MAG: DUF47 domain-containing protein [Candidatus Hodarchaeota archaeon]